MKYTLSLIFLLNFQFLYAQNKDLIFNDWVKVELQYKSGEDLSDEEEIKYSYIRYSFEKPNKVFISFNFNDKGTKLNFTIYDKVLELKNSYGIVTNSFLIEELTTEKLVLLQGGENGFGEDTNLRYSFASESSYQKTIPISQEDILSINGTDTTFKSTEKIYAKYKSENSFHEFLTSNIPEYKNVQATNNFFLASFIVRKTGEVDSLQILESINPAFDKQFIKAFNRGKKNWIPATYNGKNVDVQMKEQFKFVSSGRFLPSYDYSKKGKDAMLGKKYSNALYYFEKALETTPDDIELLYNKAACNIQLGNILSACQDLQKIKAQGSKTADALLEKNCK